MFKLKPFNTESQFIHLLKYLIRLILNKKPSPFNLTINGIELEAII